MDDDARWLDGNAIAGLLAELFGTEMTGVPRGCASCGATNAVGAHRAYRGAGIVLRCPACGDVALCVSEGRDRRLVHLTGSWTLELPVR